MRTEPRTHDAESAPPTSAPSTEQLTAQVAAEGGAGASTGTAGARGGADEAGAEVVLDDAPTVETTRPAQATGPQMTVTQAIRRNRSKRRTMPPGTPARMQPTPAPAPERAAWKDGLFPAVFGAIFSARWVVQWARDGQWALALVVGLAATAGLFAIGVGASRWLAEPAADAGDR